jgi:hypothetical protein
VGTAAPVQFPLSHALEDAAQHEQQTEQRQGDAGRGRDEGHRQDDAQDHQDQPQHGRHQPAGFRVRLCREDDKWGQRAASPTNTAWR